MMGMDNVGELDRPESVGEVGEVVAGNVRDRVGVNTCRRALGGGTDGVAEGGVTVNVGRSA